MNDSYDSYFDAINQLFATPFEKIYKALDKSDKVKVDPTLANIYRRWYYSALLDGTFLSPANIFEALSYEYAKHPCLEPVIGRRTPVKFTGLQFKTEDYSKENHPIISDFKIIIDFCRPGINLTAEDEMSEESSIEAAKLLHVNDPDYAAFLLAIALSVGLIVKIPSIHVNRAQLVRGVEKRMEISSDAMFDMLFDAALGYAAHSLSDFIPTPEMLFDKEYLLGIMMEPIETDAIFQRLYDSMGVDLESLTGIDLFEEMDMVDMALISGTYLLGLLMDKFFLTPFGHYFRLFRPLYMVPFDLEGELAMYLDSHSDDEEPRVAFYAPASKYFLTKLGLDYFKIKPNVDNYLNIEQKLPFKGVSALFNKNAIKQSARLTDMQALAVSFDQNQTIYSIKAKYMGDPSMWLNVDASESTSLHRLFLELSYYIDATKETDYILFPDETENPFMAYASPGHSRRSKKTTDKVIGDLSLEIGHRMVLNVGPSSTSTWNREKRSLEVVKVHKGKPGVIYPNVTRLGKALQEHLEW